MLALLGSDQPGERDAAALAAARIARQSGLSWAQILKPPAVQRTLPQVGTWRDTCATLLAEHQRELNRWEARFVADLPNFRRLSVKQRYALDEIAARLGVGGAA